MTPFFIIGNPRSGTTLLRLMMTSHPDLMVTPECGFALWLANDFYERDCTSAEVRVDYANQVFACKKFDTWNIGLKQLKEHLLNCKAANYSDLAAEVYHCYGKLVVAKKYCRWGDKNNFYLNLIGKISSLYPEAKFIHIIRDGRDVACSYKELIEKNLKGRFAPNLPASTIDAALEWKKNVLTIRNSFTKLPKHKIYEVRFSDIVQNPVDKLTKICRFIGVDYSDQMLDYYLLNAKNQLEPSEMMQWKKQTLYKPQQDRIGRYRNELSVGEISEFERIAGDILKIYSYPLQTNPSKGTHIEHG